MAEKQNRSLVIAISPSTLFNLTEENRILQEEGQAGYYEYLRDNEDEVLQPRTGLHLIKSILGLNPIVPGEVEAEVIVISRDSTDASLRIFNSARHHELGISRGAFTSGDSTAKYLAAFKVDLFLATSEADMQDALEAHIPAGLIRNISFDANTPLKQIRIALDGDSLLLSEEAGGLYRTHGAGLSQLQELPQGRFTRLLKTLSLLQNRSHEGDALIHTALIASENTPAMEQAIKTLRRWSIRFDAAFFSGSTPKEQILDAFEPVIFFDEILHAPHHEAEDAIKAAEEITHEAESHIHHELSGNLNTEEADHTEEPINLSQEEYGDTQDLTEDATHALEEQLHDEEVDYTSDEEEPEEELVNLSEEDGYDDTFDLTEESTDAEEAIREAEEITQGVEDHVDYQIGGPFNMDDMSSEDELTNSPDEGEQSNILPTSDEISPEEIGLVGWAKEWAVH
ncbi:MAG: 5'-nucleotidase [Chloroflexota bacterium]|nr:5'-nucleotidase [Chloroflexota bacterium]